MLKEYPVKGEKVFVIPNRTLEKSMKGFGWNILKRRLTGGYCFPDSMEIYIRESRKSDIKLLNHERGHLRGYKHTWRPTLMFPSWIGRLFNSY